MACNKKPVLTAVACPYCGSTEIYSFFKRDDDLFVFDCECCNCEQDFTFGVEQKRTRLSTYEARIKKKPDWRDAPKVALVVGHTSSAKGANSVAPFKTNEFDLNSNIARKAEELAGFYGLDVRVYYRDPSLKYHAQIDKVYADSDAWGANASVELHFNAYPGATGTETISSGSAGSRALCDKLQDGMIATLGLESRGVKVRSRRERGGRSVHAGKAPAALVEPFFGSNSEDVEAFLKVGVDGMARCYLQAIANYFKEDS